MYNEALIKGDINDIKGLINGVLMNNWLLLHIFLKACG